MFRQSPVHTFHRLKTLYSNRISALPIVILMPHSACNCRCVMCDIWKDNKNLKQLTEEDLAGLLHSLKKLQTKLVVMSGGEALLNKHFFRLCELLKKQHIHVTLLSTGLLLKKHAAEIVRWIDDVIVSLDGDEPTHDRIRNIPGCFRAMKKGVEEIRAIQPNYPVSGRSVIHRLNFYVWPGIIAAAKELALQQVSFLPADVSSTAFNREIRWDQPRQEEVMLTREELPALQQIIDRLIVEQKNDFETGFIAETPGKIQRISQYYQALHGLGPFPQKKCNAPWVSAVVEADGSVRPCFFHNSLGNIRNDRIETLLNSEAAVAFRRALDLDKNAICKSCVCSLHLPATVNPAMLVKKNDTNPAAQR